MVTPSSPAGKKPDPGHPLIDLALRTLDAEAGGVTALAGAIRGSLGQSFVAALELIKKCRGRVLVTGIGKSGHIGRKISSTLVYAAR